MRIIAHLDMDAFFAAVEERDRPYLKGQPIAVGADPQGGKGRGVVSTANYPARSYGIKSATPIRTAWALSEAARKQGLPPVVFIESGFRRYSEVSKSIMKVITVHLKGMPENLFESERPALEQVSVDECYFDLSFAGSFAKAKQIAEEIKKDIKKKERLTASIGIGPNKLIAKIASDFKKPDGLTVVPPEKAADFLAPLPVRRIPGVGPKAEAKLARLGVKTIADALELFGLPRHQLSRRCSCKIKKSEFSNIFNHDSHCALLSEKQRNILQRESWCGGKWGRELYRKFRGEDDSPVVTEAPPAKSIGEQETLPEDSLNMKVLLPYLERQTKHLIGYMAKEGFKTFRTVVLTVRFADFETVSRSRTLKEASGSGEVLARNVMQMFFPFLDRQENPRRKKIRLVGVRVEKLS